MARSKALSKGTPKNKSTDSDDKSSDSTTSDLFNQQAQAIFKPLIMMPLMTKVSLNQMEGQTFHSILFIHCFTIT